MSSKNKCTSIGIALCQPIVTLDKPTNLATAERLIRNSVAAHRPRIVTLPEFFNSPYLNDEMRKHAEPIPGGPTCQMLASLAAELAVCIVGGSIPELAADGRLFNTTTVWSASGELLTTYRKLHLADVKFTEALTHAESQVITAGDRLGLFEVDGRRFGLGICYDTFFPETAALYRRRGVDVMLYNSAFPPEAGKWWELVLRARALDNQVYVCGTSGAFVEQSDQYTYFGESLVVDGWGQVIKRAGKGEEVIFTEINFAWLDTIRVDLQMLKHKRTDLYEVVSKFNADE